jgi:hypothetical protein
MVKIFSPEKVDIKKHSDILKDLLIKAEANFTG